MTFWTNYTKDSFFAPKLSQLTECRAPSLAVTPNDSTNWLPSFVLTSVLRVNIPDPTRQLMYNVLRRADSAVVQYSFGRESLLAYLNSQSESGISQYSRCLYAFENAVAATFQGYQLLRQLHPDKLALFTRNDGTELQRLDRIYNATKHADDFIANGNRFAAGSTLPVWLINDGLESKEAVVTYIELANGIEVLADMAGRIASLEPRGTADNAKSGAS